MSGVTETVDAIPTVPAIPVNGSGVVVRNRLALSLVGALVFIILQDSFIAYFATHANEAFKNWDLVKDLLSANATAKTALISGLLGFMARDFVTR